MPLCTTPYGTASYRNLLHFQSVVFRAKVCIFPGRSFCDVQLLIRWASQPGRWCALVLDVRNHHAKPKIATTVGATIASMIAMQSMRIDFSAAPIGPRGPNMPVVQAGSARAHATTVVPGTGRLFFAIGSLRPEGFQNLPPPCFPGISRARLAPQLPGPTFQNNMQSQSNDPGTLDAAAN
jgi:hypothetical protein